MKEKLEELVFILDKSGSMSGKELDTIGSFNSTIKEHVDKDYDVLVTTVLFSDNQKVIHDRIDIKQVEPLTASQYKTDGCTALIDAMGDTISHIKDIQKHQRRPEDVPEHTLFVIVTDGMENASHKYSSDDVKRMVEQQKENGWEFLFLGANIDAVETAKQFSIDESRAVNFINDSTGIKKAHKFAKNMSTELFMMDRDEIMSPKSICKLREEVDKDYKKRK